MMIPISTEFDRIKRLISKKELRYNSRLKKKMLQIKYTISLLMPKKGKKINEAK